MSNYISPLSVIFVWHPEDESTVKPIINYCFSLLSRDIHRPFSRSMNLPIFFRTTCKKGVPNQINILSKKTIIFVFISKEIGCDDLWIDYIKRIPKGEKINIIPIALDEMVLGISRDIGNINFIRMYKYNKSFINDYMFIAITHEIYRYTLNDSFEEKSTGKDNALQIFISHAKDGKNGIKIAKALKSFIDNSSMRDFFDATDIAYGYRFDEEIVKFIKSSTVIAINSDIYSSRYWCQREILSAKKNDRPIIAVDALEEFEDRRFPFASNIPGVHVKIDDVLTEKDLLRILRTALLETVRFFYSKLLLEKYKGFAEFKENIKICYRPPEVSDIEKIFCVEKDIIKSKYEFIIYPEPPVYNEELQFLNNLGVKVNTPLTFNLPLLEDKKIGISISEPSEEELINIGQDNKHLIQLSQDIARYLLAREAVLIYGGDLRKNGFTKFLFDEAQALQVRTQSDNIYINNYIAWPIYNKDTEDIKDWKCYYRSVAKMIEIPFPQDVEDLIPNGSKEYFLPPINSQNIFVWSCCLTEMRKNMITNCDVRICAGGRCSGYKGIMPGVLEETLIAIKLKCPIFLLGGFGGITARVCNFIKKGIQSEELTKGWQILHNIGYKDLLDFCSSRNIDIPDYDSLNKVLKMENLNNGLSNEDNIRLFDTCFIDEAINLIFKGLKAIFKN